MRTRSWVILVAVLLCACLAAALLLPRGGDGSTAAVYQNGELLRAIDLSSVEEPYSFTVEGPAGTNTVEVERGRIRVSHADCPDQICVSQGWLERGVTPIVCLPNGLVIQLENAPDTGLDGVSK